MTIRNNYVVEGHQENVALFQPRHVDTAIENVEWIEYRPVSQISRGAAIEFNVPGNGMNYIDLKKSKILIKARILRGDGTKVVANDKVGFVNIPLYALFRQCDVSLQQTIISPGISTNYPYKAIFDILMNHAEDAKESQCQSYLYYKDTPGQMDATDTTGALNVGLVERFSYTRNGNAVDLEGPLYIDIMQQDRLLLNGIQVNVKLYPSSDLFCLMNGTEEQFRVDVTDAKLKVCAVKVNSGVIVGHSEALKVSPALYPFTKSEIRSYSVPKDLLQWSTDDLFAGNVPEKVIVALTDASGFSGSYSKNPFNFDNMNLNFMGFYIDGVSQPTVPFTPNYKTEEYISPYLSLFQGSGSYMRDQGNYISRRDYPNGYAIYVFDLTSNHSEDVDSVSKKGQTRLSLQFSEALPSTVSVIVYAQFAAMVRIDKARNVIVD